MTNIRGKDAVEKLAPIYIYRQSAQFNVRLYNREVRPWSEVIAFDSIDYGTYSQQVTAIFPVSYFLDVQLSIVQLSIKKFKNNQFLEFVGVFS